MNSIVHTSFILNTQGKYAAHIANIIVMKTVQHITTVVTQKMESDIHHGNLLPKTQNSGWTKVSKSPLKNGVGEKQFTLPSNGSETATWYNGRTPLS